MLPILINYKVIRHTLIYWAIILCMIIYLHLTYSPTYSSVKTADMHRYWPWQQQNCWGKLLLCSSSCEHIFGYCETKKNVPVVIICMYYICIGNWRRVHGGNLSTYLIWFVPLSVCLLPQGSHSLRPIVIKFGREFSQDTGIGQAGSADRMQNVTETRRQMLPFLQ